MRVQVGWSEQMSNGKWANGHVEVDETDLRRLLVEHTGSENASSDPWGADPDLALARTADVYTALSNEAERLNAATLYAHYEHYRTDETRADIARFTTARDGALARIVARTHVPVA